MSLRSRTYFAAAFLVLAAVPAVLRAQTRPGPDRLTIADYMAWEDVGNPRLSPDGTKIIYTKSWIDAVNDRRKSALWIMDADGSRQRFLTEGSEAIWSPDGTRIAYLKAGEPTGNQIYVRWMDAEGATSQITRLTESPSNIAWSPDGKSLAFQALVTERNNWPLELPAAPPGAKWTEAPRVVQSVRYRSDRQGFLPDGFVHLFVVSADGGAPRQVTEGDWNHNFAEWTTDGRGLLLTANRVADWEYSWRQSDVYRADVATRAITRLTTRNGPDNNPVPSPDGKFIAYTGFDSTDATWQDAALYVMNADGTGARVLTAQLDRSPTALMWDAQSRGVYFQAEDRGARQLHYVTLQGQHRAVTSGAHMLNVTDLGRSGMMVGTRTTGTEPNNIVRFDPRTPQTIATLTNVNGDLLAGKKLASVEEIWYTSVDGFRIQGWIVKPPDFDPSKKYPLMLEIHGGPHAMYNVGFSFARQDHASHGYVTL